MSAEFIFTADCSILATSCAGGAALLSAAIATTLLTLITAAIRELIIYLRIEHLPCALYIYKVFICYEYQNRL
jgi:hypothetical protein